MLSGGAYAKGDKKLESTVVTAQKVEENAQEVPISMTVFGEFDIEDKRIKSIKDIAAYTPNLMFFSDQNGTRFNPTIRGLRTESGSSSSSLGLYIDGVPMVGGNDAVFIDVERIEILKGPQGTLYGKGAEAGVINIITKKPDSEIRGRFGAELGSDNKREYMFNVGGPIVRDKLYISLSAKHYEKDGLVKNIYKGGQTDDREYDYGKIYLRFAPSDDLEVSFISQILKRSDGGQSWNYNGAPSRENSSNVAESKPETLLNALRVEYSFSRYKFESITTYKKAKLKSERDFDFTSEDKWVSKWDNDEQNLAQEFRLIGKYDRFSWLTGLNLEKEEVKSNLDHSKRETYSYGVFSHMEYQMTKKLSLLAGIRYDKNSVDYTKPGEDDADNSFNEISPKIGLEYNLSKESMVYAAVAKGYRPGGIFEKARGDNPKAYKEETLLSYEVGSKNIFLDKTLTLNAALYYMSLSNMQVDNYVDKQSFNIYKSNAAEATSKGFEFDLSYTATPNLELFASFGYNHTEYDEYKDERGDYSGNTNPMAPKYNYNLGTQYRSDRGYYARVDVNGYSDMYLDRENKYERDAFALVDAKLGYEHKNYDIYLYADNLFDKEYDSKGVYGSYVIYSDQREVGLQLTYRF